MTGKVYAFGKMPSVGDFFRLGAPHSFVQGWDDWLQQALMAGNTAMGPNWDPVYMAAPIWRFTLSPGLAGPQAVTGVLMPSVDRVGRRFPLTLLCPFDGGDVGAVHFGNDGFFTALEDLALAALEDDMTRERLEAGLAQLPALTVPAGLANAAGPIHSTTPEALAAALAGQQATTGLSRPSLWTACLADGTLFNRFNGLPQGHAALSLFDLGHMTWQAEMS